MKTFDKPSLLKNTNVRYSSDTQCKHKRYQETDYDGDYYIEYQCKDCKKKWKVEMPD